MFSFSIINKTTINFNEIIFSNCSAENGGAISADLTSVFSFTFNNSVFERCCAFSSKEENGSGGALYFNNPPLLDRQYSELNFQNTLFKGCSSTNMGGSIYLDEDLCASFQSCTFESCTAHTGGAIFSHHHGINSLTNCLFFNNSASSQLGGGSLYSSNVKLRYSFNQLLFLSNTALRGADISLSFECEESPCQECYSNSSSPRFSDGNSDQDFIADIPSFAYISFSGNNTYTCFSNSRQCKTVEFVLNTLCIPSVLITLSALPYTVPQIRFEITQNQELY